VTGWGKVGLVVAFAGLIIATLALLRDSTEWTIADLNDDVAIRADMPKNNQVSSCEVITGSVKPKDDAELWVAHTKRGDSQYFYRKAERAPDSNKWSARIGFGGTATESSTFDVYAFYLPRDYSQFMASLKGSGNNGDDGYVYSDSLPPGVKGDPLISPVRSPGVGPNC
jgi:hypothetical protein